MKARGFTLIELIITFLIIGILSVVIVTDLVSSSATAKIESARFRIKSDIIYAQNLSMAEQVNHGVIFTPASNSYSVYRQTTGNIINNPLTGTAFTVNFNTDLELKGVDIVSCSFGDPNTNQVEFNNFGIPSDGTTALSANGTVSLSFSGLNVIVTVNKNTGLAQ